MRWSIADRTRISTGDMHGLPTSPSPTGACWSPRCCPTCCAWIAKAGGFGKPRSKGGSTTRDPRAWLARLTGWRARANAAQANSFEALPFFIGAVLIAHQLAAPRRAVDILAVVFVTLRVIYIAHVRAGCRPSARRSGRWPCWSTSPSCSRPSLASGLLATVRRVLRGNPHGMVPMRCSMRALRWRFESSRTQTEDPAMPNPAIHLRRRALRRPARRPQPWRWPCAPRRKPREDPGVARRGRQGGVLLPAADHLPSSSATSRPRAWRWRSPTSPAARARCRRWWAARPTS
jgi:uncharacterized MAPEG superfamily protein